MTTPKTVRVRIAVAVDEYGEWAANGWNSKKPDYDTSAQSLALEGVEGCAVGFHWVEADVPVPETTTIQATATHDRTEVFKDQ